MEANELRIGNKVKWNDENVIIDLISTENVNVLHNDSEVGWFTVDINDIKPIPLTEEWLLKFGFVTRNSNIYDEFSNGNFKEFHLVVLKEEDSSFDGRIGVMYFYSNTQFLNEIVPNMSLIYNIEYDTSSDLIGGVSRGTKDILYIHQLQNLYFALTGEELEINL